MSEATRGDKVGDKCTSVPDAMISNAQNLAQVLFFSDDYCISSDVASFMLVNYLWWFVVD